jgi:hypothetical protein
VEEKYPDAGYHYPFGVDNNFASGIYFLHQDHIVP